MKGWHFWDHRSGFVGEMFFWFVVVLIITFIFRPAGVL